MKLKLALMLAVPNVLILLTLLFGVAMGLAFWPRSSTSVRFDERIFAAIELPISKSRIIQLLGPPLETIFLDEEGRKVQMNPSFEVLLFQRPLNGRYQRYNSWVRGFKFEVSTDLAVERINYYHYD